MGRRPDSLGYPHALLVALAAVLCLSLVVAGATSATAFGAYNGKWDGASGLRGVADAGGAEPTVVTEIGEYDAVEPEGTIAVVLSPEESYGPGDRVALREFVRDGGTLLVAEDYGSVGNDLLSDVGASTRVDGRPLRDERRHAETPAFPITEAGADHPYTEGVDEFVLNHGTTLTTADGDPVSAEATVLVNASEYAYLDDDRDGTLDDGEAVESRPVVAVEEVGDGRVVVVSDPSAFINAMLERPGNERFLENAFAAHDRVLLDYSHVTGQPPLMAATLAVRKSSALTALVGLLGLAAVAAVGTTPRFLRRIRTGIRGVIPWRHSRDPAQVSAGVDETELAAYLREQHPEWDADRIDRVITGVIARQARGDDDE